MKVLLVSGSEKGEEIFSPLLKEAGADDITACVSGSNARQRLYDKEYDIIVVNAPLGDEFGHEFAIYSTEQTEAAVMLLAKTDVCDEVTRKVSGIGIFVMPKPLSKPMFVQAVNIMTVTAQRVAAVKKQNQKLEKQLNDLRLVSRAKCLLMQELSMDENSAHHYITNEAMNRRESAANIAKEIIESYE